MDLKQLAATYDEDLTRIERTIDGGEGEQLAAPGEPMDEEDFFVFFCDCFSIANDTGGIISDRFPLESMPIHPDDPRARRASNAIYRILQREGMVDKIQAQEWLMDYFPIITFAAFKANAIRSELFVKHIYETSPEWKEAREREAGGNDTNNENSGGGETDPYGNTFSGENGGGAPVPNLEKPANDN